MNDPEPPQPETSNSAEASPKTGTPVSPEAPDQAPDQEVVLGALKAVKDPEIGVNIVDLGLIYAIQVREGEVDVEMTLTTPACPAGPQILREATEVIETLQGVSRANVKLVMSPPWSPDRMSEDARDELGMF